jgi:hypothetical protein
MESDFHLAVRPHLSAMPSLGFQSDGRGRVRRSVPMLRKTMIVLLTAAALTGGLTADAFARGGGGGGGGQAQENRAPGPGAPLIFSRGLFNLRS